MAKSHLMVMSDSGAWVPLRESLLARIARNTGTVGEPENDEAPTISGQPMRGETLAVSKGAWFSVEPISGYAYQWKRGASSISGATGATYDTVGADVGAVLSCTVTATNATGSTAATSSNVMGPIGGAPVNTVAPAITGTAEVGETLSASSGTWQAHPSAQYTYQWARGGETVLGADQSTYELTEDDEGETLTVTVTAMNVHGADRATSAPTAEVEEAAE